MDSDEYSIHESKGKHKDDAKESPPSFVAHPMYDSGGVAPPLHSICEDIASPLEYSDNDIQSPTTQVYPSRALFKDKSSPAVMHKVRPASPVPVFPVTPRETRERSISSPIPRERSNSVSNVPRERSYSVADQQRQRSNSIFSSPREKSEVVFKSKSNSALTKVGIQRRNELDQFLQHRGFSSEELDSIVHQFHEIKQQLEGGEWVTREEFKNFFGVRERSFSNHLFDVFKQRHKMHNFPLDFCPSPQMSREKPVGDDGIEMDAINLREFLCGLLLLQSSDVDKKLRMVFDLYNANDSEITRESLKSMMCISAKENNITLSNDQLDTIVEHIFTKMDPTGSGTITFENFKAAFQESPIELEERPQHTPLTQFLSLNTSSPSPQSLPFSWTINVDDMEHEDKDEIGTMHPDFVQPEYEEEDPERNQRKQEIFETIEKYNYFPQQESMPKKKAKAKKRLRMRIYASGSKYVFLSVFILMNMGFFAWEFLEYAMKPQLIGWGVPLARGFAQVLKIDTVLLLIPVSRNLLTYLRATPIHRIIPLDKNISFHKFVALTVVVATLGHWGAHLMNFYNISTSSLSDLKKLNPSYFTQVPSYIELNFLTIPGITGYAMVVCLLMILILASKRIRRSSFELFYYSHYCFIIFYAALVIHGMSHILGAWEYWKWFAGPAAIYVIERCIRVYKNRLGVKVLEARVLPDRAILLKMEMPQRNFTYKAGQYIFLNFPMISKVEWHPFTLTSAPQEDFISVHIRAAGNWTNKVLKLCAASKEKPMFSVNVDGPYGSATEHVFSYKHVIMIGAGIGVTPFASVLKRIQYRFENKAKRQSMKLKKVHFFWTCREQGAFQWFADILSQLEAHKDTQNFLEINTFLTGALAQHDARSILLWYGLQQEYSLHNVDLVTGLSSRTYWGRPNWERIIEFLFQQYPKERVGVFYCGPAPMAHTLRYFCKKYASLNGSTFYFHKEHF